MTRQTAEELAQELEMLARIVRAAARGSYQAKGELGDYIDGYWGRLVLGERDILSDLVREGEIVL